MVKIYLCALGLNEMRNFEQRKKVFFVKNFMRKSNKILKRRETIDENRPFCNIFLQWHKNSSLNLKDYGEKTCDNLPFVEDKRIK
jgi:hypothetical protein